MKALYNTLVRSGEVTPITDVNEILGDGSEYWQERAVTTDGESVIITYLFDFEDVRSNSGEAENYPWADRVVSIKKYNN